MENRASSTDFLKYDLMIILDSSIIVGPPLFTRMHSTNKERTITKYTVDTKL